MTTTQTSPAPMRRVSPAELESSLEEYFRRAVRLRLGGKCIKLAPTERGIPDRLVILPGGRIHLVELKTVTGGLSERQKLVHSQLKALGYLVPVLVGREGIDRWVREQFPADRELAAYYGSSRRSRPTALNA